MKNETEIIHLICVEKNCPHLSIEEKGIYNNYYCNLKPKKTLLVSIYHFPDGSIANIEFHNYCPKDCPFREE